MARIPLFLAPAFAETTSRALCRSTTRSFSSTACNEARHRTKRKAGRDSNKQRGVSVMRSTGTRQTLSVEKHYPELPRPIHSRTHKEVEEYATDEDHGLWGFFNSRKTTLATHSEEKAYGRAWTESDLVFKEFEDLHQIWWECHLEANRIKTRIIDHGRWKLGFGVEDKRDRLAEVHKTMQAVRNVLVQRDQAYHEAKALDEQKGILSIETMLDEAEEKRRKDKASLSSTSEKSGTSLPIPADL